MTWGFVLASALKDLKRRAADPAALVMWLGIPLLVGSLLALVSSPSQGARGTVLIADEDNGVLGRVIESSFAQGPLGTLFDTKRVTVAEGRARLDADDATALIVLPAGASDAIAAQKPLTIGLITNPAQRILPSMVQETLELLVEAAFYFQRLFGDALRTFRDQQPPGEDFPLDTQMASLATAINARLRGLRTLLFPPALELTIEQTAKTESPGYVAEFGRMFLPGLLFMSLLFIAQGMSADIWEEQTQGTLRRALSAPPGIMSFLAGKLLAGAVLMSAVAIVGLSVGVALFGLPPSRAVVSFPWIVFGGAVLLAVFLVPQIAASSQRFAGMLATMMVFPLMMVGGSFFPFETMPPWMAAIGQWTPNGQAVARLKELMAGTASPVSLALAALVMGVPAAAAMAWAGSRLRHRFERGA